MLDCNGFWSPCETVLPPSEGPVHLADILPVPLRATASFGLGKCMRAIWTLPMIERESEQEKEKAAVERISKEEEKIKEWLEMYTLLDEYEKKISAEIERKAISTEAKYRWLSLSERLPEDKVTEDEYTSVAFGSDNSLFNAGEVSDVHVGKSAEFMEDVD
ncbi:uncharacterized protein LOC126161228 [Schistocerca cancellata]|uniref:uncharacterized protein LOC126161228 n=1 Tax=Schistocerca cancellata TaxID=274614 RepID=UPI00211953C4|nr:uncharacterized protein LOC126161228 [Schistocerca cancellata]